VGQRLTPTRAAVEAYLDALNAHDADRIAACVADDFVNEHTSIGGVDRHGRAAYRGALDRFLADFVDLHYAPEQYIAEGAHCAVPYRMTAVMKGQPLDLRGVFVFAVDEAGLIARRTDYWDSGAVPRLA
jgi:steroid delta-isomerase-like uncharacterized protein